MTIITQNSRIKRYVATENQTVFAYDWLIYNGTDIKVLKNGTSLKYGTDYNVTVGNGGSVTLITGAARDDSIIIYSGTPETRTTDFNGGAVNVDAANVAIDNLTMQTQQLRRDIDSCVRNSIIDGEMSELPPKNERSNMFAKYDSEGNLSYANEVDFLKPGKNLSDVNNKEQAFNNISPLTEKGDILCYNGENNIRLSAGNSGQVLKLDENRMPFWGTDKDTSDTALIQKGDLLTRTDSSVTRLGIGTTGQVLTVGSSSFPEWKTLNQGTMSSQNASAVAITGGTIRGTTISSNTIQNSNITGGSMSGVAVTGGTVSGLTTPLPVASGGTGLNALGTANYSLSVNGAGDGLTWSLNNRLDNKHFAITANTDLNTILTPGTYCCESGTTTATLLNKPSDMGNSAFLMIVRYITANYWQQEIINNENKRWTRQYQISGTTWSDWKYLNHPFFQAVQIASGNQTISANTTTQLAFNTINRQNYTPEAGYGWSTTNHNFVAPFAGNFVFSLDINIAAGTNITSNPGFIMYLYKNGSVASNKGTNWENGYANRIYNMWMWNANKGDIFDIRCLCSIALYMTYAEGGGANYQDSALYIWSI